MKNAQISRRAFLNTGAAASTLLAACHRPGLVPDTPGATGGATMRGCDDNHLFNNWAHTITCKPARFCQPESTEEVVQIVKLALDTGKRVRTVGGGHSWAPLVLTGDVLVNLDKMQAVTTDRQSRATVQAGIRLKDLTPRLSREGLGMANLGSIREQSIAGATATGTHGTGLSLGNLSTQIVGMKLVTGTGDVLTVGADDDLLNAARVSLGALGIVTEITLQCVPDYTLEQTSYLCRFDDAVDKIDALIHENKRVRLWWLVPAIGRKDHVIVTTMNPPGTAAGVLRAPSASSAEPSGMRAPLAQDTATLMERVSPLAAGVVDCPQVQHSTGNYVEVLTVPLLPVFHRECEYAIPAARAADALREFRRGLVEGDLSLTLPVEVRFVAQDKTLLSPANGMNVCYIGASTQGNSTEVFERFEPMMKRLGGRPHWGKCYSLVRKEAEAMYPDSYEAFRRIRRDLDPKGVFTNELVQRLFD
jgi:FAD/FMN-containing dehydrogenase